MAKLVLNTDKVHLFVFLEDSPVSNDIQDIYTMFVYYHFY